MCNVVFLYLFSINLSVERGKLVAVVGLVGSGKSSLLMSMLGEMQKYNGNVNVKVSRSGSAEDVRVKITITM